MSLPYATNPTTTAVNPHTCASGSTPAPCTGTRCTGGAALRFGSEPQAPEQVPSGETISARWSMPAHALHARMARRLLAGMLGTLWDDEEATERAVQVFGEVIANAVEHGRGPITVLVVVQTCTLLCEIGDSSPLLSEVIDTSENDERHRGLAIVHKILGSPPHLRRTPTGKVVGFTLATRTSLPDGSGAPAD